MPTIHKRGTPFPQAQRVEYDFDPTRGSVKRETFIGIAPEIMKAKRNDYVRAGIACTLVLEQGMATLTTDDSTLQVPYDNWALDDNVQQKTIWYLPLQKGQITAAQLTAILQHLAQTDPPATAFGDETLQPLAGGPIQELYTLYQAGMEYYENDAEGVGYVLVHTTSAPNRWEVNVSDYGVGQIYTTSQLLSEVQSTYYWTNPISDRLAYKIANLLPYFQPQFGLMWGWKKSRSSEAQDANNRIQITTRYTLGYYYPQIHDAF